MSFKSLLLTLLACCTLTACEQSLSPNQQLEVASNGIYAGTLSEDGRYTVIGSIQHGGSMWSLSDGERLFNWNHQSEEPSILISADIEPSGNWALTSETHTLVLWDMNTGNSARFWTAPAEILDLELANGGRYALLGQTDHSAVIFNVIKGGIVRTFNHEGRVRSVDLSQDGRLAITGSEDQTAVIWKVDNGEKLFTIYHEEDVQQVAISPDGKLVFTSAKYDRAEIWDVDSKKLLLNLPLSKEKLKRGLEVTAVRFSEDGKQLLIGFSNQKVELWNVDSHAVLKSWKLTKRHKWQPSSVNAIDVSFSAQANRYIAIGSNGYIFFLE